ncbi:hypothetical protein U9R90_05455 [Streptomyces sp. E11-3]|uniref:hypothetical protein n=1 Tax=Streptomyces sp. E11-3 TaxID=3110112 RepID=UPI00398033F8
MYEPHDGDRVRITATGPTPGESIYEGTVRRQYMDIAGFELQGVHVNSGRTVGLWFSVDRIVNADPAYQQTTVRLAT